MAYHRGVALYTRQGVQSACACWRLETVGQHQSGLPRAQYHHGRRRPLPLRHAFFHAYASPALLPSRSARPNIRPVASGDLDWIATLWGSCALARAHQDLPSRLWIRHMS